MKATADRTICPPPKVPLPVADMPMPQHSDNAWPNANTARKSVLWLFSSGRFHQMIAAAHPERYAGDKCQSGWLNRWKRAHDKQPRYVESRTTIGCRTAEPAEKTPL